jgi:hypothetical protein
MNMNEVVSFSLASLDQSWPEADQNRAALALESGSVLLLPELSFAVQEGEARLLTAATTGQSKNVSLDPGGGALRAGNTDADELALLRNMMTRFSVFSDALVRKLFPHYAPELQQARTSFRPAEVAGRQTSWRKDDTRLHVDSFPSSPTRGRRILRVFANVHPQGRVRTWRLGEPFEKVAQRYVRSIRGPIWGSGLTLDLLGITKSRRSAYDHYMLRLHDRMKADSSYQAEVGQRKYEFPTGCTWMVYTDQASHAALSGQYALEQTFHLPVDAMLDPSKSPLRTLERILGRALV